VEVTDSDKRYALPRCVTSYVRKKFYCAGPMKAL
jgi:hypothetical protein